MCAFWNKKWLELMVDFKASRRPEWHKAICTGALSTVCCWGTPEVFGNLELQGDVTKVQFYSETVYSYKTSIPPEKKELKGPMSVKYSLQPYVERLKREKLKTLWSKAIAQIQENGRHQSIFNACDLLADSSFGARVEVTLKYGDWNLSSEGISLEDVNEDINMLEEAVQ